MRVRAAIVDRPQPGGRETSVPIVQCLLRPEEASPRCRTPPPGCARPVLHFAQKGAVPVVLHFGSVGRGAHSRASPMGTYAPRPMWPRSSMSGRPLSGWGAGTVPVGDPGVDGLGDGVGRAVLRQERRALRALSIDCRGARPKCSRVASACSASTRVTNSSAGTNSSSVDGRTAGHDFGVAAPRERRVNAWVHTSSKVCSAALRVGQGTPHAVPQGGADHVRVVPWCRRPAPIRWHQVGRTGWPRCAMTRW